MTLQTIHIMWLREVKKFLRSPSRLAGALGQPVLQLVALGFGLGRVFEEAGQGSYIQFLVPGIIGLTVIFSATFNGMQVIWDRQFGLLRQSLVAPASRVAIMLGRTLGGATVAAAQGFIVFTIALLLGFHPHSWALTIPASLVMFLLASLFSALGITVASFLSDIQGFQPIMTFVVMPIFFLSGSLFPLTNAPLFLQAIATFDPLSYGVDAMRALLIGVSHFGIGTDLAVLSVVASALLGMGTYRSARSRLEDCSAGLAVPMLHCRRPMAEASTPVARVRGVSRLLARCQRPRRKRALSRLTERPPVMRALNARP